MNEEPENQIFVLNLEPSKGLNVPMFADYIKFLPTEWVEYQLSQAIDAEMYEEAAVLKKELEGRK